MRTRNALALLPLALGLTTEAVKLPRAAPAAPSVTASAKQAPKAAGAAKEFSIPLSNLRAWAKTVVVALDQVKIEGNSAVHALEDDCEMHFGSHTTTFQGAPDGLVLEPMNVCVLDPPDPFMTWPAFAKSINGKTVTASGVPRIWPEHLEGGTASNPDHAAELHPLTQFAVPGTPPVAYDFAANIFAGEYHGKDGNRGIAARVTVSVTTAGASANISFRGGQIGNFTTLDLSLDRATIMSDGAGSFRMNGEATMDDGTTVAVRVVTVRGSPINTVISGLAGGSGTHVIESALVLYSLNTEALLAAAESSHGQAVPVDLPVQLILYGPTDSE